MKISKTTKNVLLLGLRLFAGYMLIFGSGYIMIFAPQTAMDYFNTNLSNSTHIFMQLMPIIGIFSLASGLLLLMGYYARLGSLLSMFIGSCGIVGMILSGYVEMAGVLFLEYWVIQLLILYTGAGDYSLSHWLDKKGWFIDKY